MLTVENVHKVQEIHKKIVLKAQRAQEHRDEKEKLNRIIAEMRKQEFKLQTNMAAEQERFGLCFSEVI